MQRSEKCHSHYSTINHGASQWVLRSDRYLSFLAQCKEIPFYLIFKIMSITCRFHYFDLVVTLYISFWHVKHFFKVTMLRKINIRLLHHFGNTINLQQTQLLIILLIRSQNTLYIHVAQRTVNKKNKHIYIFYMIRRMQQGTAISAVLNWNNITYYVIYRVI